jgi:hypothetical protein
MKKPFGRPAPVESEQLPADTLSRIRQLTADDELPTREDRAYGENIFTRSPVPLPRILTGKRRSRDS